jgi:hypothetical protein
MSKLNQSSKELTKSVNFYLQHSGMSKETEIRMQTAQEAILARQNQKEVMHFNHTSADCRRKLRRVRKEIKN